MDRLGYAAKNLKLTAVSELALALIKFFSRRIFVLLLGTEYLGISGLFTDLLSLLSLAELGFGASITYSLYGPAARGDTETIKSLMALYRRVYRTIGLVVLGAGLALTPFLHVFVKEMPADIPHIPLIYILTVVNTGVSYAYSYKSTLLFVQQRKYIDAAIRAAVTLLATAGQIAVLWLTRNYIWYLLIAIGATLAQNFAVSLETDRLNPCLRERTVQPLSRDMAAEIRRNVKAMLFHRLGSAAVFGTDNILISKFVGVTTTGLYSNYTMIRGFLNVVISSLFNAITPAMGNLHATAGDSERQTAFRRLDFFSAWLFGWMSICLYWLYDPFIDLWLGDGYLLPRPVVFLITANFYVSSMRTPVSNVKGVMGLFWDDRYRSLAEAAVNLVVSILLAKRWGIAGILAGTLVSTIALPAWIEPLVVYRRGLHLPAGTYFAGYLLRTAVTLAAGALTGLLCRLAGGGIGGFFLRAFLCIVVPNGAYLIAYRRTEELRFLKSAAKSVVQNIL